MKTMSNEEIEKHFFNDPELDIDNYDYLNKSALIQREISKQDFLEIEKFRQQFFNLKNNLGSVARNLLSEIIEGF